MKDVHCSIVLIRNKLNIHQHSKQIKYIQVKKNELVLNMLKKIDFKNTMSNEKSKSISNKTIYISAHI